MRLVHPLLAIAVARHIDTGSQSEVPLDFDKRARRIMLGCSLGAALSTRVFLNRSLEEGASCAHFSTEVNCVARRVASLTQGVKSTTARLLQLLARLRRIVPARVPRMTAADAPHAPPSPTQQPVLEHRLNEVFAA